MAIGNSFSLQHLRICLEHGVSCRWPVWPVGVSPRRPTPLCPLIEVSRRLNYAEPRAENDACQRAASSLARLSSNPAYCTRTQRLGVNLTHPG